MESAFSDGTVGKNELKRLAGEFDLESIFQLSLASRGLASLGCLPDCLALEFLDLSDNQLSDVGMLSGLKRLRYLGLARNRLSGVAGLDGCDSLQELNLAGNLIACTEDLHPLTSLDRLQSLHLQDKSRSLANPICMSAGYAGKILDFLPVLTSLDGDRVRGSDEEYYQLCVQVEQALSGSPEAASRAPPAVSGLGAAYWTLGGVGGSPALAAASAATAAAESEFAEAVAQVRDRELRAMLRIEEGERDLVRKRKV